MIPQFLSNLIGIGKMTTVDDSGELQTMQVTEGAAGSGFADRVIDKVRRVTEFGFTSVPPVDAEVVMIRRGGDRSCSVVMGTSHRPSRPRNLEPGDVAIYDVRGMILKFSEDGVSLDAAGHPVTIQGTSQVKIQTSAASITIDGGNISSSGSWVHDGAFKAGGIEMTTHTHSGVQAGTSKSGGPVNA